MAQKNGMRLRLSKIPGVTKGDSARILSVPFYFQCPPMESFTWEASFGINNRTNYKGVQFADRGGKQLRTTQIDTVAVEYGSFVVTEDWDVAGIVEKLVTIVEAGYPVRFLAYHPYNPEPELDIQAFLGKASITEKAGEPDAKYLSITIQQYRPQRNERQAKKDNKGSKIWPKTVVIKKDGTVDWPKEMHGTNGKVSMADIAQAAYGEASRAKHIAKNQKPPLTDYGMHDPLINAPRYKDGGKIIVPAPPIDNIVVPEGFGQTYAEVLKG